MFNVCPGLPFDEARQLQTCLRSTGTRQYHNRLIIMMASCDNTQQQLDNNGMLIIMTSCDSAQQEPDKGGEEGKRPEASPGPSYAGMCVGSGKRTLTLLFFDIQCEMQCQCMYLNDF